MKAKAEEPKATKPQTDLAPKDSSKVKGGYMTYRLKNVQITSYSISG